jgi:hypothetical protein
LLTFSSKQMAIPRFAVLAAGLTVAILVATIDQMPARATPSKARDCTGCHGSGSVAGTVTARPSTTTPAPGAAYTVAITPPAGSGNTGFWIANSTAAGATGTTTGVTGGPSSAASYTATMRAPAAAGTYYYKVWAERGPDNASGVANFARYSITVGPAAPRPKGNFTGKAPTRVLDTRNGIGAPKVGLGAGQTLTLTVPGLPAGATAVALNVTVAHPSAASYLSVYPGGTAKPTASNLNFLAGQTIANLVMVPLGTGGKLTFYNALGNVHVIADLVGYYAPGTGGGFTGRAPTRVLDTRAGALPVKLGPNGTLTLVVPGLPAGATAVALNVTAANPTAGSYLSVYPGGTARPTASNLNYRADQTIANMVLVSVGTGNTVTFYNAVGTVNVIADLVGYYAPGTGAGFTGKDPTRVLDTRHGTGAPQAQLGVGRTLTLTVPGLPAGATAVALNVTVTGPTAASYLSVYPGGTPRPTTSNLNYLAGQTIPNMVLVPLGPGGTVTFYNAAGTVNVIADLVGSYG